MATRTITLLRPRIASLAVKTLRTLTPLSRLILQYPEL